MHIREITDAFAVSPQITAEDVASLKAAGYNSVMCNRPDGEEYGQPDYGEIAAAAEAEGLEMRWVPISNAGLAPSDLEAFEAALEELPAPMLAYCRSGTRCATVWTITQFGKLPDADILKATSDAGYDMSMTLMQLNRQRG